MNRVNFTSFIFVCDNCSWIIMLLLNRGSSVEAFPLSAFDFFQFSPPASNTIKLMFVLWFKVQTAYCVHKTLFWFFFILGILGKILEPNRSQMRPFFFVSAAKNWLSTRHFCFPFFRNKSTEIPIPWEYLACHNLSCWQ